MASTWITKRPTAAGKHRYRVMYRVGGRESYPRYAGSFKTMREAKARRHWVVGELAALRVPDLAILKDASASKTPTVAEYARQWQASRIDVAESTRVLHEVALGRVLPLVGEITVDALTPADVAEAVASLAAKGYARGSIQKSLTALRQALDFANIDPNPARDSRVKLPREDRPEISPPTADQVEAALACVAPRYRLPLLVIEACGLRVGELEHMRWADLDEQRMRVRISGATSKTRRARFAQIPADLFAHTVALVPREDRDLDTPIFPGAEQARMRTDLGRACKAASVARFGLHDLRHRRLSMWHREGVPVAEVAARAGHARASMTLDVYTHVLVDDREVDRAAILGLS